MESERASKKFCSNKHRLYYHREVKAGTFVIPTQKDPDKYIRNGKAQSNTSPKSIEEPQVKSFQDYLREIASLEGEEECKDWVAIVKADGSLTPAQRTSLLDRLRNKWS